MNRCTINKHSNMVHVSDQQLRAFINNQTLGDYCYKTIKQFFLDKYSATLIEYEVDDIHSYVLKFNNKKLFTWFILQLT